MLKKVCAATAATVLMLAASIAPAHADLRRTGQAGWDVYQGRLGLKIGSNPSAIFGNEEYCDRGYVESMVYSHYNQPVQFVGSISNLIGRLSGQWGGSGDSDGIVYADVFDCPQIKLQGRLTGAVCLGLDVAQPMGVRYCAYGTQE